MGYAQSNCNITEYIIEHDEPLEIKCPANLKLNITRIGVDDNKHFF